MFDHVMKCMSRQLEEKPTSTQQLSNSTPGLSLRRRTEPWKGYVYDVSVSA